MPQQEQTMTNFLTACVMMFLISLGIIPFIMYQNEVTESKINDTSNKTTSVYGLQARDVKDNFGNRSDYLLSREGRPFQGRQRLNFAEDDNISFPYLKDVVALNNTMLRHNQSRLRKKRHQEELLHRSLNTWMDYESSPHRYESNLWWRLINHTVRLNNRSNCYVCALFPHSTAAGDWWPHQDQATVKNLTLVAVAAASSTVSDNFYFQRNANETLHKVKIINRVFGQVATVENIPDELVCYERTKGLHHVGKIPKDKCSIVYNEHMTNQTTRQRCLTCLRMAALIYPLKIDPSEWNKPNLTQTIMALEFLSCHEWNRNKCLVACSTLHIPGGQGTGVVQEQYWLCGYRVYVSLPRDWTGLCSLVQLHGGAIIIPHEVMTRQQRKRPGLFDLLSDSSVPKNQHIRNVAEEVSVVFSPLLGVTSVMNEVEITRYEITSFMNTMSIVMSSLKEELRDQKLTVLQNRLILDQLTAAQGGLCVVVGTTCCTYIPENNADGHLIDERLKNISSMLETVTKSEVDSDEFNWDSITSVFTNMNNLMLLVGCFIACVILMLCIWPCIMKTFKGTAAATVPSQIIVYDVSQHCLNNEHIYVNID